MSVTPLDPERVLVEFLGGPRDGERVTRLPLPNGRPPDVVTVDMPITKALGRYCLTEATLDHRDGSTTLVYTFDGYA